ncbi:hypothetical protein QL285_087490 [Trifolium repens]|nr:hypothetical protein QL285_087490 [Trifolium repens]
MDCGRFLRSGSYTTAKDRLDFARVLIATQELAVIKRVEQLLVDGSLVEVQIIEEWGFDLGDDACLIEDEVESKASLAADDDCWGDLEASNNVDMLVDQLAHGVVDENRKASQVQDAATQSVKIVEKMQAHESSQDEGARAHGLYKPVLEPLVKSLDSGASIDRVAGTEMSPFDPPIVSGPRKPVGKSRPLVFIPEAAKSAPGLRKRTTSCPPGSRPALSGPWSLEWLQDHNLTGAGVVFSAKKRPRQESVEGGDLQKKADRGPLMKHAGGFVRNSIYSLKRIARLPINDRREVLKILQKNARRRKTNGGVARRARPTGSKASAEGANSDSSVNNDWKHWVAMQGSDRAVEADVLEVGKFIGATFEGDKANMFSALSRPGFGTRDTLGVVQVGEAPKVR